MTAGDLHATDPDRCCEIRKVRPMARVFGRRDAWITGSRRDQTASRQALEPFERQDLWIKVNPLFDWTGSDVAAYFSRYQRPAHPLKERGYLSVGCAPCTRASCQADDERSGRWAATGKTECGLHGFR